MNDAANYEEFYVSCNPPLLPNGVDFVVGAAKEAHKVRCRVPHAIMRSSTF